MEREEEEMNRDRSTLRCEGAKFAKHPKKNKVKYLVLRYILFF